MVPASASLQDVSTRQEVCIRNILFDLVRHECARLGLRVGHRVRVRRRAAQALVIDLPGGRTVALKPECARFVEVEPVRRATPAAARPRRSFPSALGWRRAGGRGWRRTRRKG